MLFNSMYTELIIYLYMQGYVAFRIIQYFIFLQTHLFIPHFFATSTFKKNPEQFLVIEQLPQILM